MFQRKTYPVLALLTALLLGVVQANAQETLNLKGRVLGNDGSPLDGVNISLVGGKAGTTSDVEGRFELSVIEGSLLRFGHVSFHDTTIVVRSTKSLLLVQMRLRSVEIPQVEVRNNRPPDVVFGHADMHVADVELVEDGLLLLTYSREIRMKQHSRSDDVLYRHPKLILADRDQRILDAEYLTRDVMGLHRDHLGRVFIVGRSEVDLVEVKGQRVSLQSVPIEQFRKQIEPCVATIDTKVLWSDYDASFPSFSYSSFDIVDSSSQLICSIEDKPLMKLFRSQYKYMSGRDKVIAMDTELETGVDAEVIAAYMTGFQNNIYYEPLYAPMFVQNDTVLVFDHYNDQLRKYGPDHALLDQVQLVHHTLKPLRNWKRLLLHDEKNGVVYSLHERSGRSQLYPIDLETGEMGQPFELYHKWAKDLHVDNGEVYYIYRPFGSLQKKFLYKETIR